MGGIQLRVNGGQTRDTHVFLMVKVSYQIYSVKAVMYSSRRCKPAHTAYEPKSIATSISARPQYVLYEYTIQQQTVLMVLLHVYLFSEISQAPDVPSDLSV